MLNENEVVNPNQVEEEVATPSQAEILAQQIENMSPEYFEKNIDAINQQVNEVLLASPEREYEESVEQQPQDIQQEPEQVEQPTNNYNNQQQQDIASLVDNAVDPSTPISLEQDDISDAEFRRRVTAPFVARRSKKQFTKVDDIIRAMSMGVDYNYKLHKLKPYTGIIKALQNNKLLEESKVNTMIDIMNGDKAAIAKLISDNNIDLYSLDRTNDVDENGNVINNTYEPNNYIPSEEYLEFEEITEAARNNPYVSKDLLNYIFNWDPSSTNALAKNPANYKLLVKHMAEDKFDQVKDAIDNIERGFDVDLRNRVLANTNISYYDFKKAPMLDKYIAVCNTLFNNEINPDTANYLMCSNIDDILNDVYIKKHNMNFTQNQPVQQRKVVGNNLQQSNKLQYQQSSDEQLNRKVNAGIPTNHSSTGYASPEQELVRKIQDMPLEQFERLYGNDWNTFIQKEGFNFK